MNTAPHCCYWAIAFDIRGERWTAPHVEVRRRHSVCELLAGWDRVGPAVESSLPEQQVFGRNPAADVICHEADLRDGLTFLAVIVSTGDTPHRPADTDARPVVSPSIRKGVGGALQQFCLDAVLGEHAGVRYECDEPGGLVVGVNLK